jgi:peptide-methionine (S)-S-oxide reductase
MNRFVTLVLALFVAALILFATTRRDAASAATSIPDPAVDETLAAQKGHATVVIAGGCFWGIQAVFEHVKGVTRATAGYSGRNGEESRLRGGQHRHNGTRRVR